ncbi:MAG: hypothetical protein FH758_14850 [Firmicutes bacterium]|nr:hypothetical protein [Bacillota bacterium]
MPESKVQHQEEIEITEQGGLTADFAPGEDIEAPEPWEAWETKLVVYSVSIGVVALIIGSIIVDYLFL